MLAETFVDLGLLGFVPFFIYLTDCDPLCFHNNFRLIIGATNILFEL